MPDNFTESDYTFFGVTYKRYSADRLRGGESWVFYNRVPPDTVYNPTWPEAIKLAFPGVPFYSRITGDIIHVDFINELTSNELLTLNTAYDTHVPPVPQE